MCRDTAREPRSLRPYGRSRPLREKSNPAMRGPQHQPSRPAQTASVSQSLWPFQMPFQELEGSLSVDGMRAVEEFDLGMIGQIHARRIEPARLCEFIRDPFVGCDSVMMSALHHERARGHKV